MDPKILKPDEFVALEARTRLVEPLTNQDDLFPEFPEGNFGEYFGCSRSYACMRIENSQKRTSTLT